MGYLRIIPNMGHSRVAQKPDVTSGRRLLTSGRDGRTFCAQPYFWSSCYQVHQKQGAQQYIRVKEKNIEFYWQVPKTTMLDLHMMVAQPQDWVQPCADAGGDMYTFHIGGHLLLWGQMPYNNSAQRLPRNREYCAGR